MPAGPKYPNQQLRSVSLEAYFAGRLGAVAVFGAVQDAVAAKLPLLFVPNVQPGEASALRPFQLRDPDHKRSLALAVNQVTYVAFEYPGFEAFRDEAIPLITEALGTIGVKRLNRVVYRYENEVGVTRESDGSIPLRRVFPNAIPAVLGSGNCRTVDATFETRWEDTGSHGVQGFHARVEPANGGDALKVSVFAAMENTNLDALNGAAAKAHGIAFALFESLISEEFRNLISAGEG